VHSRSHYEVLQIRSNCSYAVIRSPTVTAHSILYHIHSIPFRKIRSKKVRPLYRLSRRPTAIIIYPVVATSRNTCKTNSFNNYSPPQPFTSTNNNENIRANEHHSRTCERFRSVRRLFASAPGIQVFMLNISISLMGDYRLSGTGFMCICVG